MKVQYDSVLICSIKTTCNSDNDKLSDKEVIEFGSCLLNVRSLQSYEPFSIIIKPEKEISQYCASKTGLTPEDVSSGVSFLDAMEAIRDIYGSYSRPWASYGTFAQQILRCQCHDKNISYPFSDRFINIKALFPIMFNLTEEVSLKEAIRKLRISIPEAQDTVDEALNAAIVLSETLRGGPLPK